MLQQCLFIWGFTSLSTLYRSYSRRVVGRAEETSTFSSSGFCIVNCWPTASNYQLSHLRPCQESNPSLRGGRQECYHSATVAPCYSSEEFHQFFQGFGFQQVTSSPHFPQSNGFSESPVSTAKATLKKSTLGKCDPDLVFLLLRSAPVSNSLPSPAELLYNRPVRSVLPSDTKYRPELESTKSVLAQMQANMKAYYNNGTKELAPLKPYDTVMVQSHYLDWSPGTIVSATEEPGSYIVHTTEGARYRRNRRFICKMPNKSVCTDNGNTTDCNIEPNWNTW